MLWRIYKNYTTDERSTCFGGYTEVGAFFEDFLKVLIFFLNTEWNFYDGQRKILKTYLHPTFQRSEKLWIEAMSFFNICPG